MAWRTLVSCLGLTVGAAAAPPPKPAADPFAAVIEARAGGILDRLAESADAGQASREAGALFDQVVFHAPDQSTAAFLEAAVTRRVVHHLSLDADPARRARLRHGLRGRPELARTLTLLVDERGDDIPAVYGVADRLLSERGDAAGRLHQLTAALCVVHDRALRLRVNENQAEAPDVVLLFDYYLRHEKRMLHGLAEVPAELLVHVVDVTASVADLEWALERYAGDGAVGARYFDVAYDHDHFARGTVKRSTAAGWSLSSILAHGGVCADQAYFAATVGKAIGVPTTYSVGLQESAHAWVGFLEARGATGRFNFDAGRYDSFRLVKGSLRHPQTGAATPDSHVALLAELIGTSLGDRLAAASLIEGAARLAALSAAGATAPPVEAALAAAARPAPRACDAGAAQALLESGLRRCPGHRAGWLLLRDMAQAGQLARDDKRRWTGVLDRLCGRRYPDFSVEVIGAMVRSEPDPERQNTMWNQLFANVQERHDLAAAVRVEQADLWRARGEPRKAGQCYEDVINRFCESGFVVTEALAAAEKLLREEARPDLVPALYERAWACMRVPDDRSAYFWRGSPWWHVGRRYADRLEEAGQIREATAVRARLDGG
jgi:hypothetical protein